jgi:hypothetical protein
MSSKIDETRIAYLDVVSIMLANRVEKIRVKARLDLKKKLRSLSDESVRVQRIQNTLNTFGAAEAVMKVVGNAKTVLQATSSNQDVIFWDLVSAALRVGTHLMDTGNHVAQKHFIAVFTSCAAINRKPDVDFFISLRNIIRFCNTRIDREFKVKHRVDEQSVKVLIKVFQLCASLCNGHNSDARNFIREQDRSIRSVDVVNDLVLANICLLEILCSHMKYISYDKFDDKLAPSIWTSITVNKRQFIAWHDTRVNYHDICMLMYAVSAGFEVLKDLAQGPCPENQQEVMKAVINCPSLLKYIGSMHLTAYSPATSMMGIK